jgi:hypothetical protein
MASLNCARLRYPNSEWTFRVVSGGFPLHLFSCGPNPAFGPNRLAGACAHGYGVGTGNLQLASLVGGSHIFGGLAIPSKRVVGRSNVTD